jgi:hypothetical protein
MYKLNIFSRGVTRNLGYYKDLKSTYEALKFFASQKVRIDRYDIAKNGSLVDSMSKKSIERTGSSLLEYINITESRYA